ncbi:MAG: hypothetical protein K6A38_09555 [Lachnospiraceae bacterium]|nr:hypothetical protein [Lachnospiraceae bacterium]
MKFLSIDEPLGFVGFVGIKYYIFAGGQGKVAYRPYADTLSLCDSQ